MLLGTKKPSEVIFELFRAMKSVDEGQADKLYSVFEEIKTLEDGAKTHSETVGKMSNHIENLEEQLGQDGGERDGVAIEIVADAEVEASFQANESDELRSKIGVYKSQAQELEQQLDQVRNVLGFNVNRQLAHNNQVMQHQILEWYRTATEITEAMSSGEGDFGEHDVPAVVDDLTSGLVASILKNVTLTDSSEDAEQEEEQDAEQEEEQEHKDAFTARIIKAVQEEQEHKDAFTARIIKAVHEAEEKNGGGTSTNE